MEHKFIKEDESYTDEGITFYEELEKVLSPLIKNALFSGVHICEVTSIIFYLVEILISEHGIRYRFHKLKEDRKER